MTPEEMGQLADQYFAARNVRLAEQRKVDKLEEAEKALKGDLMAVMTENSLTAIGGKTVEVSIVTKNEPAVENWNLLWEYIQKTGEFDLLYKRVNSAAVKERWEDKKEVPGVQAFPALSLSMHARK
jgi:hypothetical protein